MDRLRETRPRASAPEPSRSSGKGDRPLGRHIAAALALAPIRVYRYAISPLIGPRCRHLPTCSEYGEEAIRRHGAWAGGWMTLARLARCHPLGSHGLDPVPETLPEPARWYMPWRYGCWTGRHIVSKVD